MEKAGQRWWETTRWSKGGPLELQKRLLGSAHEDGAGFSLRGRGAEQRSVCWVWEVAAEAWAGPVDMATVTWAQRDTLCLPGGGPAEIVILDYPLTRFVSWALANIGGICVAQKYVGYLLRLKPDCELLFPLSGAAARADTLSARPHPLGLFFPLILRLWVPCAFTSRGPQSGLFLEQCPPASRAHFSVPWASPLGMTDRHGV